MKPQHHALTIKVASALALTLATFAATSHAATRDEQEQACRGDAIHFCKAEIPDKDKITACMKQHVSELTPGCRAMFKEGKKDPKGDKNGAKTNAG
ncbi:hypothetical protein [Paraburkholderia sp.]|uniref:hypothetical protein n=1 Tax=Paraburkholderia sp. TaxID=1926495 RepID=UPI002395C1B0|nr:hypothetical protein [Paraburkholderia sp.]MDE1182498.1 hypothetical protein [Paraburkholderia sp.]